MKREDAITSFTMTAFSTSFHSPQCMRFCSYARPVCGGWKNTKHYTLLWLRNIKTLPLTGIYATTWRLVQRCFADLQNKRSERKRRSTANPQFSYGHFEPEVSNCVCVCVISLAPLLVTLLFLSIFCSPSLPYQFRCSGEISVVQLSHVACWW